MTPAQVAHDLAVTAIDLTRACASHELYLAWLDLHTRTLNGSVGIANYLFLAAMAFEEQAHPQAPIIFDPFVARENLSDILMAAAPLSCEDLRVAVTAAIREASQEGEAECPAQATDALAIPALTFIVEANNVEATR